MNLTGKLRHMRAAAHLWIESIDLGNAVASRLEWCFRDEVRRTRILGILVRIGLRQDRRRALERDVEAIPLHCPLTIAQARAVLRVHRIYVYDNRQFPGTFDLVHPGLPRRDGLAPEEIIRYAEGLK